MRGFPSDWPADCWFPTWDTFECVCLYIDSQRPTELRSHTHSHTYKGVGNYKYRAVVNRIDIPCAGGITEDILCVWVCVFVCPLGTSVCSHDLPSIRSSFFQSFLPSFLPFTGQCNQTEAGLAGKWKGDSDRHNATQCPSVSLSPQSSLLQQWEVTKYYTWVQFWGRTLLEDLQFLLLNTSALLHFRGKYRTPLNLSGSLTCSY